MGKHSSLKFVYYGEKKSHNIVKEKTCFQNKSKFITEDCFVQHMNITTNKSVIK